MLMGIATVTIIMVTAVLHAHSRRFTDGLLLDPDRGEPFGLARGFILCIRKDLSVWSSL